MERRGYLGGWDFVEPKNTLVSQYFCNSFNDNELGTRDNFSFKGGAVIQRIGKNVLTGEEEWFYDRKSGTYYYHQFNKFNKDISGKHDKMLCTHFKWVEYSEIPGWGEFQGADDNKIMFKYDREKAKKDDIHGFKEWLKDQYKNNKPVEVYFILQYPELSLNRDDYNPNPRLRDYDIDMITSEEVKPIRNEKYEVYFENINHH